MSKATKHKAKGADSPRLLSTEILEQRAKADLSQHNYRRAKEWFKELCKRSSEQYLPQLIQCYQELAKQMLEKGQRAEAKTVFDQIKLLAGDKAVPSPGAQFVAPSDEYPAAGGFIEICINGKNPLVVGDGRAMADALVLAFADQPDLQESNPELHDELTVIYRALDYVCAERFADGLSELKKIGLQSVFSGWRLFIKGLCAFYTGDDSRALTAFSRLRGEPLLSTAARPFIFILDEHTASLSKGETREPLLRQVCAVLNRRDLECLPRAEYLWHVKRYSNSYEHVARNLTGFPSEKPGLLHTLSRFYFNAVFQMNGQQTDKYIKSIYYIAGKKKKSHVDDLLFARVRNLCMEADEMVSDHETIKLWEEFLLLYDRVHGENAKLRALVYAHLGDKFSSVEEGEPLFFERKKEKAVIRNSRLAEEAYKNSLKLNGTDKDVHLSLLCLYEKTGEVSKRNKMLDEISRLFPDDKETLVKNGHYCIERKSFIKGIEYLKRAATLDPLDRNLKEVLCIAYIRTARHFAGKGESRRYREFMGEAIGLGEDGLNNINLGLPYLKVRLAIFEWIGGCDNEGDLLWEDVLSNGDGGSQLTYFAYLLSRVYEAPAQHSARLEKKVTVVFKKPIPAAAAAFTDILQYVKRIDPPKSWIAKEFDRLNKYVLDAAAKDCTPGKRKRLSVMRPGKVFGGKILRDRYIRIIIEQDPQNPLFLYFKYMNEKADTFRPPTASDLRRLKDILEIAVNRNERLLINLLNENIRLIEDCLPLDDEDGKDWDGVGNEKAELKNIIDEMMDKLKPRQTSPSPKKKDKVDLRQTSLFDDIIS